MQRVTGKASVGVTYKSVHNVYFCLTVWRQCDGSYILHHQHHHNLLKDKTFPSIATFSFTYPIQGFGDWSLSHGKRWGTLWTTCQSLAGLTQTHTHSLSVLTDIVDSSLKTWMPFTVGGDHIGSMLDSNLGPCYCEVIVLLCCYTTV